MIALVFLGPTLTTSEARAIWPDALYMPPVRQGDVYRALRRLAPDRIGIVDGYFARVPSVWHKEILYAMSEGCAVYGSASMGALRATELAQFGMVGIGRIFEAYRDGMLEPYEEPFEDDDEVAVLHGPEETGYVALSEALVNIRCTLAEAAAHGVIASASLDALAKVGKALFYAERSYKVLLAHAQGQVPDDELGLLRAWLPGHQVNQKRADAIAMLEAMRDGSAVLRVPYVLANTSYWERAKEAVDGGASTSPVESETARVGPPSEDFSQRLGNVNVG